MATKLKDVHQVISGKPTNMAIMDVLLADPEPEDPELREERLKEIVKDLGITMAEAEEFFG